MSIGFRDIFKHSVKFNLVNVFSKIITFPISIFIASLLTPGQFGIIGLFGTIGFWFKKINPGILQAVIREIPVLYGSKRNERSFVIQNIGLSYEYIYYLIQAIIFLSLIFFFEKELMIVIVISAISYFFASIYASQRSVLFVRKHFNKIAKYDLLLQISTVIVSVILTYFFKEKGYLAVPIVTSALVLFFYQKESLINYKITFRKSILRLYLKNGLMLSFGTFAIWAFRAVDRTVMATFYSFEILGYFTFAMSAFLVTSNFFEDFGRVLQPILWENAAKSKERIMKFRGAEKQILYLNIATCASIWFFQLIFKTIVITFVPKFTNSIPIFNILIFNVVFIAISIVPSQILNSSLVNKQKLWSIVYTCGIITTLLIDLFLIYLKVDYLWLFVNTIVVWGVVGFVLVYLSRKYFFDSIKEWRSLQVKLYSTIVFSVMVFLSQTYIENSNISQRLLTSNLFAIALWILFVIIFFKSSILDLLEIVKNKIWKL